ncbi:hypothetical protein K488DRAFT_44718 [Vararia minispora EC-137]|uniref:Uncharacterized protein n=1 Tax=Vararia minispora EC-137 TaxID=1314806 RepID=A0ACB8QSJ9_9AGAM|nr:hypothetical protein K488DRAFT_44718 [Vararia minispora EC-137]
MDGLRDRKRPRPELDEELLIDHPTLYHEDGNAIIKCGRVLFCVHKSILARQSPVFRGMLSAEGGHPTLRGLVLLELDDDKDDIEAFLNAIYDGMRVDMPKLTVENFPALASAFRVAMKYEVARLRDDVLVILKREWPSKLTEHIGKSNAFKAKLRPYLTAVSGARVPNPDYDPEASNVPIVHPSSVIALLREGGVQDVDLLAPLFYDLSRRIWQLGPPFSGHNIKYLPSADVERLLYGSATLRATHARMASTIPSAFIFPSQAHAHVHTTRHAHAMAAWWSSAIIPQLLHDIGHNMQGEPVEDWETARTQAAQSLPHIAGDCVCCKGTLDYMSTCQTVLWDNIAGYFGLT